MICERCCTEYAPPVNRPTWPKCEACTLTPAGRYNRQATGAAPAYPLPPPTPDAVTFIVPGRPVSVNRSFVGGNFRHSREARAYRANVAAHALQAVARVPGGRPAWDRSRRFTIAITAYFATNRSDSDNVLKPVKDALQGIVYDNDRQVVSDHTEKYVDPIAPRLVVTVRAA